MTTNFNTQPSHTMHIDLNSCFASVEQQANPNLRGKPVVVAAYPTGGGCVLSPSREAKKLGIKTGMRVREAKEICPNVIVLTPDPPKYRHVHKEMMKIFNRFTPDVFPKSIDEAVLNFGNDIAYSSYCHPEVYAPKDLNSKDSSGRTPQNDKYINLFQVAQKIKRTIKQEIGEGLTVSIGLAPNRFLAKTAAGLKKPDGLEEINHKNIIPVFSRLSVEELYGIGPALKLRLNGHGIFSALDFLNAKRFTLDATFRSILARHWYLRLRGFEVDDWQSEQKSLGHSYALTHPTLDLKTLRPLLYRLCEKVGRRLRRAGLEARGVYLSAALKQPVGLTDKTQRVSHFHQTQQLPQAVYATPDLYQRALDIINNIIPNSSSVILSETKDLDSSANGPRMTRGAEQISILAVGVFNLSPSLYQQQTLFEDQAKKKNLTKALDEINNKFGEFSVSPGSVLGLDKKILDRIAFGGIRDI